MSVSVTFKSHCFSPSHISTGNEYIHNSAMETVENESFPFIVVMA